MRYEDKVLMDIVQGKETPKRIMVPVGVHNKIGPTQEELQQKDDRNKALLTARMPWFCPKCEDVMNGAHDRKFYYMRGTCFDCVIKEETTMRINGTYELYEKRHVLRNAISRIQVAIDESTNTYNTLTHPSFITENGGIEVWEGVDLDGEKETLRVYIEELTESKASIEVDLMEIEDEFKRKTEEAGDRSNRAAPETTE